MYVYIYIYIYIYIYTELHTVSHNAYIMIWYYKTEQTQHTHIPTSHSHTLKHAHLHPRISAETLLITATTVDYARTHT